MRVVLGFGRDDLTDPNGELGTRQRRDVVVFEGRQNLGFEILKVLGEHLAPIS